MATDRVVGLGVDSADNVVVVGETFGALGGAAANPGVSDAFVRKYSALGAVLWTRQFGSTETELVRAVHVDGSGYVYVGGTTWCGLAACSSTQVRQAFVRKYNDAGTEEWTRIFGDGTDVSATAADSSGNVYVVGNTRNPLPSQTASGDLDCFVRKYNSAGTELWTRQFGTSASEQLTSVSVDSSGNLVVSGSTEGALGTAVGLRDAFIRRYDPSGREVWTRQFGSVAVDNGGGVVLWSDGTIYLAGTTSGNLDTGTAQDVTTAFLRKYDSAGGVLWTRQLPSAWGATAGYASTLDGAGNAYLAGEALVDALPGQTNAGNGDILIRKYSSAGLELSTMQYGGSGRDLVFAVGARGATYVGGEANGSLPGQAGVGAFVVRFEM